MVKPGDRREGTVAAEAAAASDPESGRAEVAPTGRVGRKPYRRPAIEKRRSLSQATLIGSGGGAAGTATGGAP